MKIKNSGNIVFVFCLALSFLFFASCTKTNVPPTQPNSNTIRSIISSSSNATFLDTAIRRAGLDSMYTNQGPFTFFAATDQAFTAAGITNSIFDNLTDSQLKKIILYNTIYPAVTSSQLPTGPNASIQTVSGDSIFVTNNGNGIYVNGIPVVTADLIVSNGIIDAVSQLILPPAGLISQIAQADTSFSYFDTAVARTSAGGINVGNMLSNGNIYTLFLPDNDAFRLAGYATIADINAADPDTLARVLLYHILPTRTFTSDFITSQGQQTLLNNETVSFGIIAGTSYAVKGNGNITPSAIIASNIMARNGVIHVINQLLKP
jgi:uncharacterized surface protein with fasciclin (FAS1) repeats